MRMAFRFGDLVRFGGVALVGLAGAAGAQVPVAGPMPGTPAPWRDSRFDLARLGPDTGAVRDRSAGLDVELAPGVVGGIGASDRQRGANPVVATVTPLFQRQAQLSGRLGVEVGGGGLLFGRLGYAEFDLGEAFARSAARSFSAGGVLVGGGAEARLSPALSFTTEYHAVSYTPSLSDRQLLGGLAWHY